MLGTELGATGRRSHYNSLPWSVVWAKITSVNRRAKTPFFRKPFGLLFIINTKNFLKCKRRLCIKLFEVTDTGRTASQCEAPLSEKMSMFRWSGAEKVVFLRRRSAECTVQISVHSAHCTDLYRCSCLLYRRRSIKTWNSFNELSCDPSAASENRDTS